MKTITRKEFIDQVGIGAALLFVASCAGSCKKKAQGPSGVNFTIDISTGALSTNGGYLVQSGVIVARTNTGAFMAVASTCTHQGGTLNYSASSNQFVCPLHGATFNSTGGVVTGPASTAVQKYNTSLSGNSLHVFS